MIHVREVDPNLLIPKESSPFDWDGTQYILADVVDALQTTNYLLQLLNQKDTKGAKRPKKPEPYRRPGAKYTAPKEDKQFAKTSDLSALWG